VEPVAGKLPPDSEGGDGSRRFLPIPPVIRQSAKNAARRRLSGIPSGTAKADALASWGHAGLEHEAQLRFGLCRRRKRFIRRQQ